jgi:hypothetical protein
VQEAPLYVPPQPPPQTAPAQDPPPKFEQHERMRIRAAAFQAARLYPGPVGEMLSRELFTWDEFGYRLGGAALVMRLVDHILKATTERPAA